VASQKKLTPIGIVRRTATRGGCLRHACLACITHTLRSLCAAFTCAALPACLLPFALHPPPRHAHHVYRWVHTVRCRGVHTRINRRCIRLKRPRARAARLCLHHASLSMEMNRCRSVQIGGSNPFPSAYLLTHTTCLHVRARASCRLGVSKPVSHNMTTLSLAPQDVADISARRRHGSIMLSRHLRLARVAVNGTARPSNDRLRCCLHNAYARLFCTLRLYMLSGGATRRKTVAASRRRIGGTRGGNIISCSRRRRLCAWQLTDLTCGVERCGMACKIFRGINIAGCISAGG